MRWNALDISTFAMFLRRFRLIEDFDRLSQSDGLTIDHPRLSLFFLRFISLFHFLSDARVFLISDMFVLCGRAASSCVRQ